MMPFKIRQSFAAAVLFVLASGFAMGQSSVTYTTSTSPAVNPVPNTDLGNYGGVGLGDFPDSLPSLEFLALPLFDTSLGVLNSFSLTVTAQIGQNTDLSSSNFGKSSEYSVDNTAGADPAMFTETVNIQMYVLDGNGISNSACVNDLTNTLTGLPGDEQTASCLLAGLFNGNSLVYSNSQTLNSGDSLLNQVFSTPTVTTTVVGSSAGTLSEFSSSMPGSLLFPVFYEGTASVTSNNGDTHQTLNAYAGLSASIQYDYTPVDSSTPEPASMFLIGIGLAALGTVSRFRRKAGDSTHPKI